MFTESKSSGQHPDIASGSPANHAYVERVVNLLNPANNQFFRITQDEAETLLRDGAPEQIGAIEGSFALLARRGKIVRMARTLDRPMRYFLAKRQEGPALLVADRIDTLWDQLRKEGLEDQFHPSYTRMVPAHYVVDIELIGCPDPDPCYTRFFTPQRDQLPADIPSIGERYIQALAHEISQWLQRLPEKVPIGVAFSGGIDSGAVFLVTYFCLRKLGMNPARLKAFTLDCGEGPDLGQARQFLKSLDLELFLEPIHADPTDLDVGEALRTIEDYKPLDVECALMTLALCRGIRRRYPDWQFLVDGDGGDENLKAYPIEENPELTIRSVVHNLMLYHEGWGVGRIKHSLTYSGGLSRGYVRSYAPSQKYQFDTFSPFTRASVIAVSEAIPYISLTNYEVPRLYDLKGAVVREGIRTVTGFNMPVFPKRRFQHGAIPSDRLEQLLPLREIDYRRRFLEAYSG